MAISAMALTLTVKFRISSRRRAYRNQDVGLQRPTCNSSESAHAEGRIETHIISPDGYNMPVVPNQLTPKGV